MGQQNTSSSDYSLHFMASASSSSSTMRSYPDHLETEEEFELPHQSKRQCNWEEIERGLQLDTNDYIRDQMQDTWTSSRGQSIKSRSFGKPDSGESSPENRADARFMINMRRNERVAKQNEGLRRNNDPMMVSWNTPDQRDNTDGGANYFWNSKQHRPFEF